MHYNWFHEDESKIIELFTAFTEGKRGWMIFMPNLAAEKDLEAKIWIDNGQICF